MPKPSLPLNDASMPRFPPAARTGALPDRDKLLQYVIAVLDRIEAATKCAHTVLPATDWLMVKLGAERLSPEDRPSPSDWWRYLNDRLDRAPKGTVKAVRAWGEETTLAMLKVSSQAGEGAAILRHFRAILDAADEAKLDDEAQRTLSRLRSTSRVGFVAHVTAWEGFEQLIVPLPKLKDIFSPSKQYSESEAARMLGVDPRTLKKRIEDRQLPTETKRGKVVIRGTVLNSAFPGGHFQNAPRGSTRKGSETAPAAECTESAANCNPTSDEAR